MLDFGFYNMDCMQGMAEFPDKYFDLAIVDPPYGIGASRFTYELGSCQLAPQKAFGRLDATKPGMKNGKLTGRAIIEHSTEWDKKPPSKEYFAELNRVSKNQIIWGGNYFDLPPTRGIICWDKEQPFDNFSKWEMAWTSFNYPAKLFRYSNAGFQRLDKDVRIHPTQKPVALYKWLLTNYAKQGDKILDTHVGSASSLIACYDLGFDYVGFEIDEEYYNKAKQRLEEEMAQIRFIL